MGPLSIPLSSLTLFYARVYGLSLPIRPFQGPLYTVIGSFYPRGPPSRGFRGGLGRL